jgi:hypothetical protein
MMTLCECLAVACMQWLPKQSMHIAAAVAMCMRQIAPISHAHASSLCIPTVNFTKQ